MLRAARPWFAPESLETSSLRSVESAFVERVQFRWLARKGCLGNHNASAL